jgi:hypothetical protein
MLGAVIRLPKTHFSCLATAMIFRQFPSSQNKNGAFLRPADRADYAFSIQVVAEPAMLPPSVGQACEAFRPALAHVLTLGRGGRVPYVSILGFPSLSNISDLPVRPLYRPSVPQFSSLRISS